MRTSVAIPEADWRAAKFAALAQGISLGEMIRRGVAIMTEMPPEFWPRLIRAAGRTSQRPAAFVIDTLATGVDVIKDAPAADESS